MAKRNAIITWIDRNFIKNTCYYLFNYERFGNCWPTIQYVFESKNSEFISFWFIYGHVYDWYGWYFLMFVPIKISNHHNPSHEIWFPHLILFDQWKAWNWYFTTLEYLMVVHILDNRLSLLMNKLLAFETFMIKYVSPDDFLHVYLIARILIEFRGFYFV